MKRRILALVLALAVLLTLAACGKQEEEEPDRYGGIRYVPVFRTVDTDMNEVKSGCVAGDCVYLTGSAVTNEDYQDRAARLLRIPLDGGEIEELSGGPPSGGDRNVIASTEGLAVASGGEGTVWMLENVGRWFYDFPEDFDPYDMSDGVRGQYYLSSERFYVLRELDLEGNELSRQEWTCDELEERMGLKRSDFVSSVFLSARGDITFESRSNKNQLVTADKTGTLLGRVTQEEQSREWYGIVRLGDGRLAVWGSYAENGSFVTFVQAVSPEGDAWEETWTLPGFTTVYDGDADTLFYYNEGSDLLAWQEPAATEDGGAAGNTPLLSWVNTGLDSGGSRSVSAFLPDGRLVIVQGGGTFSREEPVELAVLTPTDDPPEKTVLTLGTTRLMSGMEEAVRKFNRTNPKYQIEVREYMDFNAGEDRQDAINRLATEVGAGKIPDILDTYGMPVYGWAASGVLEDLWPWIDLDRDIDREDLMVRVLEADSIGGKLYEVAGGFSFATAIGAKDIVGDRMAWTPEEMWAAMENMPEGSISMPYGREYLLREILQTHWERLVDWEKKTCSFDSEEFREILEFCGQFPEEGMGHEEQKDMLQDRAVMLLTRYPGSFWDMQSIKADFRGATSLVGLPNPWGAVGSCFDLGSGMAMTSSGQHKEGVWEFLRTMLLPGGQSSNLFLRQFPINKENFEAMSQEDGNGRYGYSDSSGQFHPYRKPTQADREQVMALYEAADSVRRWDRSLGEIIVEIAGAYFAGDKTLDETAELIQNRAQLYLDEQR